MSNAENFKLIQKAKRRDPEAFTELMNLYMKDMYRTAIAILMNDGMRLMRYRKLSLHVGNG